MHTVEASTPFCAIDPITELRGEGSDTYYPQTTSEIESRHRFSTEILDPKCPDCGIIRSYKLDRPFNGASIAVVAHPACAAWAGNLNKPATSPNASPLLCKKLILNRTRCKNVGIDANLEYSAGGRSFRSKENMNNGKYIIHVQNTVSISRRPVWGLHCFNLENFK